MIIIFMRHGEAEEEGHGIPGKDEWRRLTQPGIEATQTVSRALRTLGIQPTSVFTSPLVRAVQTAEEVVKQLSGAPVPMLMEALSPGHSWKKVRKEIQRSTGEDDTVLLVGHQPEMGNYILAALGHKCKNKSKFPLTKSGFVALSWAGDISDKAQGIFLAMDPVSSQKIITSGIESHADDNPDIP